MAKKGTFSLCVDITPVLTRVVDKYNITADELLFIRTVAELAPFARGTQLVAKTAGGTIQRGLTVLDNAVLRSSHPGKPLMFSGGGAALGVYEAGFKPKGTWSTTARIKAAQLPQEGRIRFIQEHKYHSTKALSKGPNGGYIDRFGNEWKKGPSRTAGEAFEWDVKLSESGKQQLSHLAKNGKYINVSLKGRITHK